MTPLTNTQGLSRIETVSIVGIACFAVVLLLALGSYMLSLMQQGNDANALNTAQGVAAVEGKRRAWLRHTPVSTSEPGT